MEAMENATIETLKSSYANAAATACLALGHGKSERNESEAKRYAQGNGNFQRFRVCVKINLDKGYTLV